MSHSKEEVDKNTKICQFWCKKLMSLSKRYEESVLEFLFLARHHLKVESYHYIYIVIFGKHLSNAGLY